MKTAIIVGARPNFIKIAPLVKQLKDFVLIHTGQHYDYEMSNIFFDELDIPKPKYNLGARKMGEMMLKLEPVLLKEKPDLVVVVGDVNSTLAGALVASQLKIPIAHIEAGLRSYDKTMPEEVNRVLTDHISNYLLCSEPRAILNLKREGITKGVYLVGNIMIDNLAKLYLEIKDEKDYAVLTLHRPDNVDDPKRLAQIIKVIKDIKIPMIWPKHPRIKKAAIPTIKPVGYKEMMELVVNSKFVITDSGGLQAETTYLGIPCLTLRKTTEQPITVSQGTNTVCSLEELPRQINKILNNKYKRRTIPKLWDGKTAERIISCVSQAR